MCQFKRYLHGLKQSLRKFNTLMREWLVEQGWTHCMSDPCIYTLRRDAHMMFRWSRPCKDG
jgi:hypothetical protein